MRVPKLILFILLVANTSTAQEMWGISNSNFSGNMGIFLNPTIIVGAPFQYEINLVAYDQFAENTFIYFPVDQKFLTHDYTGKIKQGTNYFTTGAGLQNGFYHQLVLGPSYIRNKTTFAWGIHSAFRSETSILKAPTALATLITDNFHSPQLFGTKFSTSPFSSAYASWFELGGTYGKIYKENEKNIIKWAANVNLLVGLHGYSFESHALEFTPVDSSQLIVHAIDATLSHTTNESPFGFGGIGLSTTLGAAYIKNPNRGAFDCNMSNDRQRKYKYRLGVSLIDLGMIRYFSNTQKYVVYNPTDFIWNGIDSLNIPSMQSFDTTLMTRLGGSVEEKSFSVWLPLALSVQFDYQLRQNLFANASIVNRLRFINNQIARGNQLNTSIRYERRRFEGALNFTLFEYKQPSLGIGLRYRFFVIGTDRLLQMLNLSDAKSFDIFFGLKFQFCKRPFSPGPDCPAYLGN